MPILGIYVYFWKIILQLGRPLRGLRSQFMFSPVLGIFYTKVHSMWRVNECGISTFWNRDWCRNDPKRHSTLKGQCVAFQNWFSSHCSILSYDPPKLIFSSRWEGVSRKICVNFLNQVLTIWVTSLFKDKKAFRDGGGVFLWSVIVAAYCRWHAWDELRPGVQWGSFIGDAWIGLTKFQGWF